MDEEAYEKLESMWCEKFWSTSQQIYVSSEQPKSYGAWTSGSVFVFCNEEMHQLCWLYSSCLCSNKLLHFPCYCEDSGQRKKRQWSWLIPDRQDEKICPFTVADGGASGCFNARENDTSLLRLLRWIYFSVHTPCFTCSSYVRISDLSSSTWRLGEKSINKHVAQFEGQSWPILLNWVLKYSFVTCKFSMQ